MSWPSSASRCRQEWRNEVVEALDRALGDVSRLAERQLEVADALRRGDTSPQVRSEQGAIEEGVERLLEQVKEVAGKNAMVSQQSSIALSAGRDDMRSAREALSNAAPNSREATRRSEEAVDALNAAAHTLLRSRGAVEGAGSGSGLQEAMEQMAQMAQQQGQLGQQSGGMLPQMGKGGGQMQEQLRALGAQQRALAERLERMRAGGQMPGAADLAQEAKELARTLEAGRLDRQTVERQEKLFRRMLDAGRTLQGEQKDEKQERQSTAAKDDSVRLPPALQTRLRDDAGFRIPSWEELQQLSPAERRRAVEYFRQLSETTAVERENGERVNGNEAMISGLRPPGLPVCRESRHDFPFSRSPVLPFYLRSSGLGVRAGPRLAQDTMSRAFDLERRGSYAQAAEVYKSVLKSKPAEVSALLGLERALTPINRLPEMLPAGAGGDRSRPRICPESTEWVCARSPRRTCSTACRVWSSCGPARRRETRRHIANGPLPRCSAAIARWPGEAYQLGRERLGKPEVLAAEMAQLASRKSDWPTAVREWTRAVRQLPGYRSSAITALGQAPERTRPGDPEGAR